MESDGSLTVCTRSGQTIRCSFQFPSGSKPNRSSDEYRVHIESPPLLIFTNANMSDYYVIDMSQHAATLITRVVESKFAGAKVCQGMDVTESERKMMEKPASKGN
jgi:hypothetical protein